MRAQSAHAGGGRVLLHCSQGVSRSATLAIAYLMWQRAAAFDEVLAAVKAVRGVANPNIGFICQVEQALRCMLQSIRATLCTGCMPINAIMRMQGYDTSQ